MSFKFQVSSWLNCELCTYMLHICCFSFAAIESCFVVVFIALRQQVKIKKTTGYGGLNIRLAFLNKHIIEHIIQSNWLVLWRIVNNNCICFNKMYFLSSKRLMRSFMCLWIHLFWLKRTIINDHLFHKWMKCRIKNHYHILTWAMRIACRQLMHSIILVCILNTWVDIWTTYIFLEPIFKYLIRSNRF